MLRDARIKARIAKLSPSTPRRVKQRVWLSLPANYLNQGGVSMAQFRVPRLSGSNIVIRLTEDPNEIADTNRLVFGNYVSAKYWENDAKNMQNIFLHTPMRKVIVALENDEIIGTISVILDSPIGLPSDGAQATLMQQLRAKGGKLAEISGLAVDRLKNTHPKLALFLLSYAFQYAYYYQKVDRVAASCVAPHADFYVSAGIFIRISGPTAYSGRRVAPLFYLLNLDLLEAHDQLAKRGAQETFLGFMLRDPQHCQHFPPEVLLMRRRETDGIQHGDLEVA